MRQILFRIPLDGMLQLGGVSLPWFGFGILLAVWVAFGLGSALARRRSGQPWQGDDVHGVIVWTIIAGLIVAAPQIQRNFVPEGVPIFGYGFMLFLGFVAAVTLAGRRAAQQGLSPDVIWDLAPWLLIPGILGARIYHCVQFRRQVFEGAKSGGEMLATFLNLSQGGLVLYGGLLGGTLGFFAYCHRTKLNPLGLADLITPSVFLGIGFGRIGCLLNGCCYGDVCSLPWAIRFPNGSVPFQEMVRRGFLASDAIATPWLHPTQIYSALDGFLIAALTAAYYPYRHRNGEVFGVGLTVYATTRFLIEFLRGDELGQLGTGLTTAQLVSLAMFATGLAILFDRARRPASRQIAMLPANTSAA